MDNSTINREYHFGCKNLESDNLFAYLNAIILFFGIFGIFANLVLVRHVVASKVLEFNVILFLTNLSIVNTCLAITVAIQTSYNLSVSLNGFSTVPAVSSLLCSLSYSAWSLFNTAIESTFAIFAIERVYRTFNLHKLNADGLNVTKVVFLSISWIIPAIYAFLQLLTFSKLPSVCYCDGYLMITRSSSYVLLSSAIHIGIQCCILAMFLCVYRSNSYLLFNFGINRAISHSLTQRFQVWNNVRTTKGVFPLVVLNLACTITLRVVAVITYYAYKQDPDMSSLNIAQLRNVLAALYIVAHPLLIMYQRMRFLKASKQKVNPAAIVTDKTLGIVQMVSVTNQLLVDFHITAEQNAILLEQMWSSTNMKKEAAVKPANKERQEIQVNKVSPSAESKTTTKTLSIRQEHKTTTSFTSECA